MKVRYEERNGRVYAYTSTSKRVPGVKNPVSMKRYLGVVDPETGDIMEKKPRVARGIEPSDGVKVREYGGTLVLKSVADRVGVTEDLEKVFGDRARQILAIAIAAALKPCRTDMLDHVLRTSCTCELCGLDTDTLTNDEVRRVINSMTLEEIRGFFTMRRDRHGGLLTVYGFPLSRTAEAKRRHKGFMTSDERLSPTIAIINGRGGYPVGFVMCDGRADVGLRHVMSEIRERGTEFIYAPNPVPGAVVPIEDLVRDRIDFVIPYTRNTKEFQAIEADYRDVTDPQYRYEVDGEEYYMKQGTAGLLPTANGFQLIPESNRVIRHCDIRFRTFMIYEPKAGQEEVDFVKRSVVAIRDRLNGQVVNDPDSTLAGEAGALSRFLSATSDPDGTMHVSVKRTEFDKLRVDAGRMLVITTRTDWEGVLKVIHARSLSSRSVRQYYGGAENVIENVGKGVNFNGRLFIDRLAIILYWHMQKVLDESTETMDLHDALMILSSYKIVGTGENRVRSGRVRRVSRLLRLFEVNDLLCPDDWPADEDMESE